MSDDVTIPAAFARIWAKNLRERYGVECAPLADLLDPKPRSLRDEVAEALSPSSPIWSHPDPAQAVLAVVSRHVAELPLQHPIGYAAAIGDVLHLLRGGDDA